jgi:hypothetical protein
MTQAQRDAIYNQYPNIAPSTGANTPNYVRLFLILLLSLIINNNKLLRL